MDAAEAVPRDLGASDARRHPFDRLTGAAGIGMSGSLPGLSPPTIPIFVAPHVIAIPDPSISREPEVPLLPTNDPVCEVVRSPNGGRAEVGAAYDLCINRLISGVILDHKEEDSEAVASDINDASSGQLARVAALHARQCLEIESDQKRCKRARAEARSCEGAYSALRANNQLGPRRPGAAFPQAQAGSSSGEP